MICLDSKGNSREKTFCLLGDWIEAWEDNFMLNLFCLIEKGNENGENGGSRETPRQEKVDT